MNQILSIIERLRTIKYLCGGIYTIEESEEFLKHQKFMKILWNLKDKKDTLLIVISYWNTWSLYQRVEDKKKGKAKDIMLGDLTLAEIMNLKLDPSKNIFISYRTFKHDLTGYERPLQTSLMEDHLSAIYEVIKEKLLQDREFNIVLALSDLGLLDKEHKKSFYPLLEKAKKSNNFSILLGCDKKSWQQDYLPQFFPCSLFNFLSSDRLSNKKKKWNNETTKNNQKVGEINDRQKL